MARILILGGGFGGLTAAEKLAAAALGSEHQVTLVSQNSEFTFYPALVHVAFGNLEPADIKFDLKAKLEDLGVRYVQGEVIGINSQTGAAKIHGPDFNGEISADYLIIALGRRLATEKAPGFFEHAHHLLGTSAALKFRSAVEEFESGRIVIGLCPDSRLPVPVCETALALAEKFAAQIANKRISISLVFPETIKKAFSNAQIHEKIEAALSERKIEIIENFPISEIKKEAILADEKSIDYDLLMLLPPFQGETVMSYLPEGFSESNYLKVDSQMRVAGTEGIYACGDITDFSGSTFASLAIRQAETAAANVLAEIAGEQPAAEYQHDIADFIDKGGANVIFMHFGIWDQGLYRLKGASFPSWARHIGERFWKTEPFQTDSQS